MSERDLNNFIIKFLYWAVILMLVGFVLVKVGVI
jgi:hypothetical protein